MSTKSLGLLILIVVAGVAYADGPANTAHSETAATTRTAPKAGPTSKPAAQVPAINGDWTDGAGTSLTLSQTKGTWKTECSYSLPGQGDFKWQVSGGTVGADKKMKGTVRFVTAPKDFPRWKTFEATVAADGKTITGTMKWPKTAKGREGTVVTSGQNSEQVIWTKVVKEDKATANATVPETKTTYDRFKDETTVETSDLNVEVTSQDAQGVGEVHLSVKATFKGQELAGQTPTYRIVVSLMAHDPVDERGQHLILLVDGVRMDFAPELYSAETYGGIAIVSIDKDKLHTLTTATKVEGQLGLVEFKLSDKQISDLAALYGKGS